MAETSSAMTPGHAAQELRRIERYEEDLSGRTAALTLMVWGPIVAAIILSMDSTAAGPTRFGWVWLPVWLLWVFIGGLITQAIWNSHAIRPPSRAIQPGQMLKEMAFVFLFWTAAFLALFLLIGVFGVETRFESMTVLLAGLFAVYLARARLWDHKDLAHDLVALGAFSVILALAMAVLESQTTIGFTSFLAAVIAGATYFLPGYRAYQKSR